MTVRKTVKAELISIGDEVLTGHTIDSNASFIAQRMIEAGCDLQWRVTVGDDVADIVTAIRTALTRADVVITTGGLGPTHDDRTKEALCAVFHCKLVHHPEILEELLRRYAARKMTMPRSNENQAMLPDGARLFPNQLGSAVGICMEQDGKSVIALPGVPREMMQLMTESVVPYVRENFPVGEIVVHKIRTSGITESKLSEILTPLLQIPEHLSFAYLPSYGGVDLRFIAKGDNREILQHEIESIESTIRKHAEEFIYGVNNDTLESVVGGLLRDRGETLSVAESCTAGMLGATIANVPGSSVYFMGGVISYDNSVKKRELGVTDEILRAHGAVSSECAAAMASGAREKFKTNYSLSITGIAGPDGGSPEKPVGLVWFGLATPVKTLTTNFRLTGDRQIIRTRATSIALDLLRRSILGLPTDHRL